MRYWLAALCIWLATLYNLERWNEPINIASFFYVYLLVVVVAILLIPWLQHQRRRLLFLIVLPPYFLLKIYFGYPLGGHSLPITVTEIAALFITIILVRQVVFYARILQEALVELTSNHFYHGTYNFEDGQGQIYREIRRARNYERPATLLAIRPTKYTRQLTLNRFVKEAQEETVKRYIGGRIAQMLKEELPDSDVITQRNNHFIVLMPEIDRRASDEIINQIHAAAKDKLGLEFAIGASSFPGEAITFESLLDKAEQEMKNAEEASNSYDSSLFSGTQPLDQAASAD
jgi:hypothetical protein